jgi:hypothetical protein
MEIQKVIDTFCFTCCKEPASSCENCKLRAFENYFNDLKKEKSKNKKPQTVTQKKKASLIVNTVSKVNEKEVKLLPPKTEAKIVLIEELTPIIIK